MVENPSNFYSSIVAYYLDVTKLSRQVRWSGRCVYRSEQFASLPFLLYMSQGLTQLLGSVTSAPNHRAISLA